MTKVKATFYLPLYDNNGQDLSLEIATVEDHCFLAFGGWTFIGHFKGAWKMKSGKKAMDTSAVYHVVLDVDELDELKKILLDFKYKAKQEAIYLEITKELDVYFL